MVLVRARAEGGGWRTAEGKLCCKISAGFGVNNTPSTALPQAGLTANGTLTE